MVGAVAVCCTGSAAESRREVPLVHDGAVLKVPVVINRQLVKLFVLDSGSSAVQVPAEVFLTRPQPDFGVSTVRRLPI